LLGSVSVSTSTSMADINTFKEAGFGFKHNKRERSRKISESVARLDWPECRRPPRDDEEAFYEDGLVVAVARPLTNQDAHDRAHLQDFARDKGAFLVPIYLLAHDRLSFKHADA
jgi:hypothetical protein